MTASSEEPRGAPVILCIAKSTPPLHHKPRRERMMGFFVCLLALCVGGSAQVDDQVLAAWLAEQETQQIQKESVLSQQIAVPCSSVDSVASAGYSSLISCSDHRVYVVGAAENVVLKTATLVEGLPSGAPVDLITCGSFHCLFIVKQRLYSLALGPAGDHLGRDHPESLGVRAMPVHLDAPVVSASAGFRTSVAVTLEGHVYAFGEEYGPTPARLPEFSEVASSSSGGHHTLLHMRDGTLKCFGSNAFGACGEFGDTVFAQVQAGGDHNLALAADGRLYSWGWAEKGQLGLNVTEEAFIDSPEPVPRAVLLSGPQVDTAELHIETIAAGGYGHSAFTTADGRMFAFGWDEFHQLGVERIAEDQGDVWVPRQVTQTGVRQVASGSYKHTTVLLEDGTVLCTGHNGIYYPCGEQQ